MRRKKPVENKDFEFARPMADATKQARDGTGYTQDHVAESIDVDTRTIINIENGNGNPTMEKLYPLIRFYGIDPKVFFYPELSLDTPPRMNLRLLLETCTEQEAAALIPIVRVILETLRTKDPSNLRVHTKEKMI